MKTITKTSILIMLLGIFIAANAFGDESRQRRRGGRHHSPPPEAYTACEDKSAGDAAEFVSPRGDTVTGICEEEDGRLVLRPDNPPQRPGAGADEKDDDEN